MLSSWPHPRHDVNCIAIEKLSGEVRYSQIIYSLDQKYLNCQLVANICSTIIIFIFKPGMSHIYIRRTRWTRGLFIDMTIKGHSLCHINTLRPRQNARKFPVDIFKCIFLNENVYILIKVSLRFVPKGPMNDIPALVQIMAWHWTGDKPLSEPMMLNLLTHICITRPHWDKIPPDLITNEPALVYITAWRRASDRPSAAPILD